MFNGRTRSTLGIAVVIVTVTIAARAVTDPRNRSALATWLQVASDSLQDTAEPLSKVATVASADEVASTAQQLVEQQVSHDPSLDDQVQRLLTDHCAHCHSENSAEDAGFAFDVKLLESLYDEVVVRGDPAESLLYQQIASGTMPPADHVHSVPLSDNEKILVRDWIASLASERLVVQLAEEMNALVGDYRAQKENASIFYFSLRHLYNHHHISDRELNVHRFAFFKLINSLSWTPELYIPEPVDTARTIYRVDVSKLGWQPRVVIRSVSEQNPYSMVPQSPVDQFEVNSIIRDRLIRMDWFTATVSQPNLYHTLLFGDRAIQSLGGLLAELGVDYELTFSQPNGIHRGFINYGENGSGPSDNYRVLDELQSPYGPVWISYDFASNEGPQNILDRPWGPPAENRVELAFQQNGGEVIFHLPNGMLGFLIVDSTGARLNDAPESIVQDDKKLSPYKSTVISNGGSCFRCHAGGLETASLFHHQNLVSYPGLPTVIKDQTEFAQRVAAPNQNYRVKLASLAAAAKVLESQHADEPITMATIRFNGDVPLSRLAAEFEQWESADKQDILNKLTELDLTLEAATVAEAVKQFRRKLSASHGQITRSELESFITQQGSNVLPVFGLERPY